MGLQNLDEFTSKLTLDAFPILVLKLSRSYHETVCSRNSHWADSIPLGFARALGSGRLTLSTLDMAVFKPCPSSKWRASLRGSLDLLLILIEVALFGVP